MIKEVSDEETVLEDDSEILEFEAESEPSKTEEKTDNDRDAYLKTSLEALGIDYGAGMRYCMGSLSFYEEILNDFVKNYDEKSKGLNSAYEDRDTDSYAIVAHSLKSTSKMIGANDLSVKARDMELSAKDKDISFVLDNHKELTDMYKKTVEDIKKLL